MPWTKEQRIKYANPESQRKYKQSERGKYMRRLCYQKHKAKTIQQNWIRQIGELGCSPEEYETRLIAQNRVCKLCGKTNGGGKRLAVDHDHKTLKVRGLLCNRCNTALGSFNDDAEMLRKAAEYLCHTQK